MSESDPEKDAVSGISDDQLPEDLVPGEDNPLAEGLEDGETAGDLYEDGKQAEQSQDDGEDEDEDESAGTA